jgi:hypothetical protein
MILCTSLVSRERAEPSSSQRGTRALLVVSFIGTYFLLFAFSVTCKGTAAGGKFSVNNPSLESAVESWTALMYTLDSAKPEWWTNANVDTSDYSNGTSTNTGTGVDALGASSNSNSTSR